MFLGQLRPEYNFVDQIGMFVEQTLLKFTDDVPRQVFLELTTQDEQVSQ